jgi:hypothetical protein
MGNLEFCGKGPLDEGIVRAVDELWEAVRESTLRPRLCET